MKMVVKKSDKPNKKLMAVFTKDNGRTKTTHFGAKGMDDYDLDFLQNENKKKKLTIKQKNDIIIKAKKLIALHKNGYIIERSLYNNFEDIIKDCHYISQYGDISSVRRAIKFINEKYNLNIICNIANETKELLNQKEEIKKSSIKGFSYKTGKFVVDFN